MIFFQCGSPSSADLSGHNVHLESGQNQIPAEDLLPLSKASLMRLTSLCDPGTRKIPSWWSPDTQTFSHLCFWHRTSPQTDWNDETNCLTMKIYEADAAFNHHRNLLSGALRTQEETKETTPKRLQTRNTKIWHNSEHWDKQNPENNPFNVYNGVFRDWTAKRRSKSVVPKLFKTTNWFNVRLYFQKPACTRLTLACNFFKLPVFGKSIFQIKMKFRFKK